MPVYLALFCNVHHKMNATTGIVAAALIAVRACLQVEIGALQYGADLTQHRARLIEVWLQERQAICCCQWHSRAVVAAPVAVDDWAAAHAAEVSNSQPLHAWPRRQVRRQR